MNDTSNFNQPSQLEDILKATAAAGFTMASDLQTGALLRTLAATKPGGMCLELGTGTGLSTAWILAGMDISSSLISVDNDGTMQSIARQFLGTDSRVEFVLEDGGGFLERQVDIKFDFIFADTWPGKYTHLELTLGLLKQGGLYIIDDMLPQPNWPPEHFPKVPILINTLEARTDFSLTKLCWSTGLIIVAKVGL